MEEEKFFEPGELLGAGLIILSLLTGTFVFVIPLLVIGFIWYYKWGQYR